MKRFLTLLALLLLPAICLAQEATFVGKSEYIIAVGTGTDAEAIALEDAKRLALEQAGTYLESLTIVENNAVTLDRIKVIARGTAKLVPGSIRKQYETIDPSTGAQRLILEAQFAIDPEEVAAELNRARSGPDLGAAQDKYDAVIAEDQRLQAELLQTTDEAERAELIEKYQQSRNRFYSMQWHLRGLKDYKVVLNSGPASTLPKDELKRVIVYFDKGIGIDPTYGDNYLIRGYIKGLMRQFSEALLDLDKALELLPPEQAYDIEGAKEVKNNILELLQSHKKSSI